MDITQKLDMFLSEKKGVCSKCGRKTELEANGMCKDCQPKKKSKRAGAGSYV